MALQIVSADSLATNNGIKIVVFGRSGLGKTMLSCTVPNPIILSAESGMLSLKRENIERVWGVNTPGITYDIPVIQITSVEDLDATLLWLQTDPQAQHYNPILDSTTEIAEQVLAYHKKNCKDPRQAYGELIDKMTQTIKDFRDLPNRHVVLICKEEVAKDESGAMIAMPSMPGSKMGPATPYLTDEVFHLCIATNPDKTSYRYLKTQPDYQSNAKDRSGALDAVEYPHLGAIINKIISTPNQAQPTQ